MPNSLDKITRVADDEATRIIETREPLGMFYLKNEMGGYTGIDNRSGDAWTEDFYSLARCKTWLKS